jgi:F-type H+-transporting ATPase subunit epsilon
MLYEGEASAVNAKTLVGEITVLDHHQPLISMLTEGAIRITDNIEGDKWFEAKSGFIEVEPGNSGRLLIEV